LRITVLPLFIRVPAPVPVFRAAFLLYPAQRMPMHEEEAQAPHLARILLQHTTLV
jgi:hypothetical protein